MLYNVLKYNDRFIKVYAYNVKTERDLLFQRLDPYKTIESYHEILKNHIESNIEWDKLTTDEKYNIFYNMRALSCSGDFTLQCQCNNCGTAFLTKHSSDSFMTAKHIEHPLLKDTYSDNVADYFKDDINYEDIDIQAFAEIEKYILANRTQFNFTKTIKCPNCKNDITINLRDIDILSGLFSEYDHVGFYTSIVNLMYFGKADLHSILNDLYPFERNIYIELINKQVEQQNKNKKNVLGANQR